MTPHELVEYSRVSFCSVGRKQTRRLEAAQFTLEQIEVIENNHQKLVRAYHAEKPLKPELDSFNHRTSFFESWDRLRIQFPNLYKFAGGLASVFPGTAIVEADSSKIKREKDDFRQSLSDFGLQCVLHCEQRKKIEKVWELLQKLEFFLKCFLLRLIRLFSFYLVIFKMIDKMQLQRQFSSGRFK